MISIVIVATNRFGDYAGPFIKSLLKCESGIEIVLVDSNSPVPYPESKDYKLVRFNDKKYNLARMVNAGVRASSGEWLIVANDDVLCNGDFSRVITGLNPHGLYGPEVRRKHEGWGVDVEYLYGWYLVMHRGVYFVVGEFDENYGQGACLDIDYSWRASRVGVPISSIKIPWVHLADIKKKHRRNKVDGYRSGVIESKDYFLEKVKNDRYI